MRILFLSQLVPYPADAGPKIRVYYLLQHLAAAGHEVTLVAFRRPGDRQEDVDHLQRFCRAVYTVPLKRSRLRDAAHLLHSIISAQPFLIRRDQVPAMHETIASILGQNRFDAIHADQLWMAQYALAAPRAAGRQPSLVLDQHNAMYLIPQRMAQNTRNPLKQAILKLEARNLARYEIETCQKFEHVVWVSEEDLQAVQRKKATLPGSSVNQEPQQRQRVIPICVDLQAKAPLQRKAQAHRVTFLGSLHWPPNAEGINWFAQEVWPLVRETVPQALLTVIGKNPPPELAALARSSDNVDVTGYVADPLPYLQETAVFVVPLTAGGGMRVKIVDAWSWGLPIVSTSIGAEGTRFQHGKNLLIADEPASLARAVICLLQEPQLGRRLADAGRKTVADYYDWQRVYRAWDAVYGKSPS